MAVTTLTGTFTQKEVVHLPAQAAADATAYVATWRAPIRCTVTAASFIPTADITGDNSNTRTLALHNFNHLTPNTSIASKAFPTSTNATAATPVAMTLTVTTADLDLAAGDVIRVQSAKTGTGLAIAVGAIEITYTAR